MNVLLTGSSGFVGSYVSRILPCISLAEEGGGAPIDLRDICGIRSFLSLNIHSFDAVIHLAAQSFVPESFKNPRETFDINFTGTFNLLTALKEFGFKGRMVFVSSGDIYGLVGEDRLPITEEYTLNPRSPYAVSKVAAESLCYQWSVTENMEIVIARPFNHIGPNQSDMFVISNFAKQIVEIELGFREPAISAGNIDTTRDFLDVRDVADAYKILLKKGINSGIYNVCSGTETTIRSAVDAMLNITGVEAEINIDSDKLRPNEQKRAYGSNQKIKTATGWEPMIPLKQSLFDTIGYWRSQLKNRRDKNKINGKI